VVNVSIVSNLDEAKQYGYPYSLPALPRVGDYIQAPDKKRFKVCAITFLNTDVVEIEVNK